MRVVALSTRAQSHQALVGSTIPFHERRHQIAVVFVAAVFVPVAAVVDIVAAADSAAAAVFAAALEHQPTHMEGLGRAVEENTRHQRFVSWAWSGIQTGGGSLRYVGPILET